MFFYSKIFSDSGSSKNRAGGSRAAVGGKTKKQIKHHCHLDLGSPRLNSNKRLEKKVNLKSKRNFAEVNATL